MATPIEDIYFEAKNTKIIQNKKLSKIFEEATSGNKKFRTESNQKNVTKKQKLEEDLVKLNKQFFGDDDIRIVKQITQPDGQKALGSYGDRMIEIVKGKADAKDTYLHEAVHKAFDVLTTEDEAVDLIMSAKKYFKTESFDEAEEMLAESFIKYAKDREGVTGKLKEIFDKVIKRFSAYDQNKEVISTFYDKVRTPATKRPTSVTTIKPRNTPDKFVPRGTDKTKHNKKINTSDDVAEMVETLAKSDEINRDIQSRGKVSFSETEREAMEMGIDLSGIRKEARDASKFAAKIEAIKQTRANKAGELHDYLASMPKSPSDDLKIEASKRIQEFLFIDRSLKSISTEHGRAISILRKEVMPQEFEMHNALVDEILKIDPKQGTQLDYVKKINNLTAPENMFKLAVNAGVEVRTAFLLYSPTTHIVNVMGNLMMSIKKPIEKKGGEIISALFGHKNGVVSGEASAHMAGTKAVLPEAMGQLKKDLGLLVKGADVEGIGHTAKIKEEVDMGKLEEMLKRMKVGDNVAKKTDNILKTSFRALTAFDNFFRTVNFGAELYSQSRRMAVHRTKDVAEQQKIFKQLIDNPESDRGLFEDIIKEVDKSVFQEDLPEAVQPLMLARQKSAVAKFIIPFMKTPFNIMREAYRSSPLGFLRPMQAKYKNKPMTQAEEAMAYSQAAVGTVLAYATLTQVVDGKITGSTPTKRGDREEFYASGKQPYSILIGDKWYSYKRLEPFATIMAMTANINETTTGDKFDNPTDKAVNIAGQFARNVGEMSMMQGVFEAYEAITEPELHGERWIKSQATSLVPSIIGHTARTVDPVMRDKETLADAFKSITPEKSKELPAKIDVFGNEIKRQAVGGLFLSPIRTGDNKTDPFYEELRKVKSFDASTQGVDKINGISLTGKVKEEWMRMVGKATEENLRKSMDKRAYKKLETDEARGDYLRKVVTETRSEYRDKAKRGSLKRRLTEANKRSNPNKEEDLKALEGQLFDRIRAMSK